LVECDFTENEGCRSTPAVIRVTLPQRKQRGVGTIRAACESSRITQQHEFGRTGSLAGLAEAK
jgi:hypothetical protein